MKKFMFSAIAMIAFVGSSMANNEVNCYAIGKAAYDLAIANNVSASVARKIQNGTEATCIAERKKAAKAETPKITE
jgi:histidinol phosphatase-like enzyme